MFLVLGEGAVGVERPLSALLKKERDALEREIREVFADVSREGGVSWSETYVLDDYGSDEECAAARARDLDQRWWELVDWVTWHGAGGVNFLDAIGFRYYLPALMLREMFDKEGAWLSFHLELSDGNLRAHTLKKWSLLNRAQRRCVKRFLKYMVAWSEEMDSSRRRAWRMALRSYWNSVE